jgi:hypothetical protein
VPNGTPLLHLKLAFKVGFSGDNLVCNALFDFFFTLAIAIAVAVAVAIAIAVTTAAALASAQGFLGPSDDLIAVGSGYIDNAGDGSQSHSNLDKNLHKTLPP